MREKIICILTCFPKGKDYEEPASPTENLNGLSIENRRLLAKELHRRSGASPKQLARVTGLDPELRKALL